MGDEKRKESRRDAQTYSTRRDLQYRLVDQVMHTLLSCHVDIETLVYAHPDLPADKSMNRELFTAIVAPVVPNTTAAGQFWDTLNDFMHAAKEKKQGGFKLSIKDLISALRVRYLIPDALLPVA